MNATELLARIQTFKREPIELEGGSTVYVREVSAAEAAEYTRREADPAIDNLDNAAWLAARVLCDEDGKPLLTDDDAADKIKAAPLRVLKAIGKAAARVSGWADDDAKKNEPES